MIEREMIEEVVIVIVTADLLTMITTPVLLVEDAATVVIAIVTVIVVLWAGMEEADLAQEKGLFLILFCYSLTVHTSLRPSDRGWGGGRYESRDSRGPPPSDRWGGPPRRSRSRSVLLFSLLPPLNLITLCVENPDPLLPTVGMTAEAVDKQQGGTGWDGQCRRTISYCHPIAISLCRHQLVLIPVAGFSCHLFL
jgi:hypothetical protein